MRTKLSSSIAVLGLLACTHKPTDELTNAKASLIAARELGANESQTSQMYLELARRETQQANEAMEDGDNHRARLLLERAQADADLAMSLAREEPLRAQVKQTLAQVRTLQSAARGGTPEERRTP